MDIRDFFRTAVQEGGISDIHLTVNSKPIVRKTGDLQEYSQYPEKLDNNKLQEIIQVLMNEGQLKEFEEKGELDFSYSIPGLTRFRVNAYRQRGTISVALRVIPTRVPSIEELGLPEILKQIALQRHGLVLCTGPTGSGKSTTLAAMINEINDKRNCHILTLEDPIEYLHSHGNSIVHQREVGIDTMTFAAGLRAALRQDPDVILVGEMRDLETISIALEAAETGHLVLATLHTTDAAKTVDRIIDVFPAHQQQQVRIQLSSCLNAVIAQQLLPRIDREGMVAALEILIGTAAVRNIIREGNSAQLETVMQTGAKYGMVVMNNYLVQLYERGIINMETVLRRCTNPEYVKKRLGMSS
ncbi:MAG TPA: type IV pilus twitching motility protein PilT [Halanaerobiaceae bacterium]|nr:type IV pilus twitching motility protein PilT [Halanaerobiaceae bacterium]HOA41560.1 type IV pilus twitching motility protein PilT [Halanaerobiales bacterium]HPZ63446.1 type IV pilus twitching motility protein PilT [Halanaerobiales bacterium]HQD04683.1 type IV pilus twitching motility protein PilT [Halanaerobiales bacterium]